METQIDSVMNTQNEYRFEDLPAQDQEYLQDIFSGKKLPPLYSDNWWHGYHNLLHHRCSSCSCRRHRACNKEENELKLIIRF